jgi:hypothetical protein
LAGQKEDGKPEVASVRQFSAFFLVETHFRLCVLSFALIIAGVIALNELSKKQNLFAVISGRFFY